MAIWNLKGAEYVFLENIDTSTIHRWLEGEGQKDSDLLSKESGEGGGEGEGFKPKNLSWVGYEYFFGATQHLNLCKSS